MTDLKKRYEELDKAGKLDDRWERIAYSEMAPEDKYVVAICRWATDLMNGNYESTYDWDDRVGLLLDIYGEPKNPTTRETFMFCKGAHTTYDQLMSQDSSDLSEELHELLGEIDIDNLPDEI